MEGLSSERILVVEDEENILEAIKYSLGQEGFEVHGAGDGEIGLQMARELSPDLIILDVMLPKIDGFEVCRLLRRDMDMPIFMLSARVEEIDRVVGLEIGADDYITKPFSMRELIVRVRNSLRRAESFTVVRNGNIEDKGTIRSGSLLIDLVSHTVYVNQKEVELKPREFDLLTLLASNKGRAYSRNQILENLWGYGYIGDIRTVDVHIRWLREKIENNPSEPLKIVTIRGVGYRFDG